MSPETPSKPTKLCPTCGTRLSEDAVRCLVCGSDLSSSDKSDQQAKTIPGNRMPEITLGLPAALGLFALFITIGAVLVYFALQRTGHVVDPTPTSTVTLTVTPTVTPTPVTPTVTDTPLPSPTPLTYIVKANDTCAAIAASFKVSIQSIVLLNNLPAECNPLSIGQQLIIPQPTPTVTPLPTATLSPADATEQACKKVDYVVQENDTLGGIAAAYGIPMAVIQEYNGLTSDNVILGQTLTIPLCKKNPTPGPTPTATLPPPYPAPNLLLPADGADLSQGNITISLQWASVGELGDKEAYAVTVIDRTSGEEQKLVDYVTDTKYIIPETFRPVGNTPHIFGWFVMAVRQTGTDDQGNPIWEPAGAASSQRVFIWMGGSQPLPTATP
jgi:LysM repeat protein